MHRRNFLVRSGLLMGSAALSACGGKQLATLATAAPTYPDWESVMAEFELARDPVYMAAFLFASHPRPVREAIEFHRSELDKSPVGHLYHRWAEFEGKLVKTAAAYLDVDPKDIAITDSTTEGLAMLYGGMQVRPDQEMLCTDHDHYSTQMSFAHRALRTGAKTRQIPLYKDIHSVTAEEIVETTVKALRPSTRVFASTWVHSSTGLKLPIRAMADAIAEVNAKRDEDDRVIFCVDGVHGFGYENTTMPELGCDFFISGTHKWLFGPRGTGLVWGKPEAWPVSQPTIPTFNGTNYARWEGEDLPEPTPAHLLTPGGFKTYEYRWSVPQAFEFVESVGRQRIEDRTHELAGQMKAGLQEMKGVKLITPMERSMSGGIVCFDVDGLEAKQVVKMLGKRGVVATETPYAVKYPRVAPSILNTEADVKATLDAIASVRSA